MTNVDLAPIAMPDTTELQALARTEVETAEAMVVDSPPSLEAAAHFLRGLKTRAKAVNDKLNGPIGDAHSAHKSLVALKKECLAPLGKAECTIKGKVLRYQQEMEAERRRQEEALRKKAREEEETRRLAEAERLEAEGEPGQAEQVLDAPIAPTPVVLPPAAPKPEGLSRRVVWKFEVMNASLIPMDYMKVDEAALGALARNLKERATVPGVRFYAEEVLAAKSY